MRKFLIALFCPLLISACASGQAKSPSSGSGRVWNTFSSDGKLVIIGAAGRQLRRGDAVTLALEDAAKKAAFFYGVYGRTETFVRTGVTYYDFDSGKSVEFVYDDEYRKYIEQFEFDEAADVFEEEDSVFVRVRFNGGPAPRAGFAPTPAGKAPEWIRTPPRNFDGYTVGVGFSLRHSYYKDAVIASYEAAAASILNKVHSQAGSSSDSVETDEYTDTLTVEAQIAEGFLTDFYVLETWVSPSDKSVWTLAVAKDGGRPPPELLQE
jgi:hypothetical protein